MLAVVARSRAARRLIAAGAAALALLLLTVVLIVATLMGGLAPQSQCGVSAYAPSAAALADIPGNYLRRIQGAGARYGLDWTVIAGIYSIESNFGRSNLAACARARTPRARRPGTVPQRHLGQVRDRWRRRRRRHQGPLQPRRRHPGHHEH